MATIYRGDSSSAGSISNAYANFVRDIADAFTFYDIVDVDAGTKKYYITATTYIQFSGINSTSLTVSVNNGNVSSNILSASSTFYYEIIKSAKGDVLVRTSSLTIPDYQYAKFMIISSENQMTETTQPAIAVFSNIAGVPNYIIDDTVTALTTTVGATTPNSSSFSTQPFASVYNPIFELTIIVNLFAANTKFVAKNSYVMALTARPYQGNCIINGKDYYCCGFLAMLDENS